MAVSVNTNVSALNAQRHMAETQNEMGTAMERLASGKRINGAMDDAAGLAISARMQSQVSGLKQAARNANDAISLVQTAEGAMQEMTEILQRVRELAIQAANGAATNADRVNLHKEVSQLQEELGRIANTTRFNNEVLMNGSFTQKDFQIGTSNQEEISVNIDDLRPEKIGAYTQATLQHVGLVQGTTSPNNVGSQLSALTNGVVAQTVSVRVGEEAARTVQINAGDDARTIADKLNQSGAQINSTATNVVDLYISSTAGSFTFNLSSSSSPDIVDQVSVGSQGIKAHTLAAEVNAKYADHNIRAEVLEDDNGDLFVRMTQEGGYDINIDAYSPSDSGLTLDIGGKGLLVLDGQTGKKAVAIGGTVTIDAPQSFLLSTDDATSSVFRTTRPGLSFDLSVANIDEANSFALWDQKKIDFTLNGVSKTITLDDHSSTTEFATVVADINAKLAAATAMAVRAEYEPSTNTLEFIATDGLADTTSSLVIGTDSSDTDYLNFVSVGFVTDSSVESVTDLGGDPLPEETVRYVSQIDIATRESALLTMTVVDAALETINSNRAGLGAVANRLESTISNLNMTAENTSASLSRIMDADFAAESTSLARTQVLQQAATAMLAQANASTQTVLRLLE